MNIAFFGTNGKYYGSQIYPDKQELPQVGDEVGFYHNELSPKNFQLAIVRKRRFMFDRYDSYDGQKNANEKGIFRDVYYTVELLKYDKTTGKFIPESEIKPDPVK